MCLKRWAAFFLFGALILAAVCAQAASCTLEDVRRQTSQPWQATYKTRWRTVSVDVQPTVPDGQTMPVLMVKPAFWTPEATQTVDWRAEIPHADKGNDAFTLSCGDLYGEERTAMAGVSAELRVAMHYAPLDMDYPYAPCNDLTLRQMAAALSQIMGSAKAAPFGTDMAHPLYVRTASCVHRKSGKPLLPASMSLQIATTLRDIPIWGHVIQSVENHQDSELFYDPGLFFTMRSNDSYTLIGKGLREESELAADVPLCSADQVITALEQEITAGHIRAIYAVDLGYALYNIPGQTRARGRAWMRDAVFYAAPAWRCVCLYSTQAAKALPADAFADPFSSLYFKTLYVNAQTGLLMDPCNGKRGCGDYPGVILWEKTN